MTKKKTLVLGASENPERYSNKAIKKLAANNHPIIAIGNKTGLVGNIPIHTAFENTDDVDTITLYLSAKNQIPYIELILAINPKRIIFNPGTENIALEELAISHNINVTHACTLVLLSTNQY